MSIAALRIAEESLVLAEVRCALFRPNRWPTSIEEQYEDI
jgi:hypothetical protein